MNRLNFTSAALLAVLALTTPSSVSAVRFTSEQTVRIQTNNGWFQFLVWDFGTGTGSISEIRDGTSNTIGFGEIEIAPDNYVGVYAYDYTFAGFTDALYFLDIGGN